MTAGKFKGKMAVVVLGPDILAEVGAALPAGFERRDVTKGAIAEYRDGAAAEARRQREPTSWAERAYSIIHEGRIGANDALGYSGVPIHAVTSSAILELAIANTRKDPEVELDDQALRDHLEDIAGEFLRRAQGGHKAFVFPYETELAQSQSTIRTMRAIQSQAPVRGSDLIAVTDLKLRAVNHRLGNEGFGDDAWNVLTPRRFVSFADAVRHYPTQTRPMPITATTSARGLQGISFTNQGKPRR